MCLHWLGLRKGPARRRAGLTSASLRGQADGEGGALADLAGHRDIATQHLAEAAADGEAEAGAAVFAGCGGIGLNKVLEQLAHLFRTHADSGIGHGDADPFACLLLSA